MADLMALRSTETALLNIRNNAAAMDQGKVAALMFLDLSTAFDKVDHSILIHRYQHRFG